MSTKIHHGYRLAAGTDIWSFQAKLRATMNSVRDMLDAQRLVADALRLVDAADVAGEPRPAEPLMAAARTYVDQQSKLSADEYGRDPYRFEVAFGIDPAEQRIMALLFTESALMRFEWEQFSDVEPYGYWNNTDRPNDVTEPEWAERKDAWDRVLGRDAPAERMLEFTLRLDDHGISVVRLAGNAVNDTPGVRQTLLEVAPEPIARALPFARNRSIDTALERSGIASPGVEDVIDVHFAYADAWEADSPVLAAFADALDPGAIRYVLTPTPEQMHRPADMTAVDAAIVAYLDEHGSKRRRGR